MVAVANNTGYKLTQRGASEAGDMGAFCFAVDGDERRACSWNSLVPSGLIAVIILLLAWHFRTVSVCPTRPGNS